MERIMMHAAIAVMLVLACAVPPTGHEPVDSTADTATTEAFSDAGGTSDGDDPQASSISLGGGVLGTKPRPTHGIECDATVCRCWGPSSNPTDCRNFRRLCGSPPNCQSSSNGTQWGCWCKK